jgi:toxin YoeB
MKRRLLEPKLSGFLLDLHQSLAHQGLAKSLDISIGMPAFFANLAASRSWHISSQKTAQLRLKLKTAGRAYLEIQRSPFEGTGKPEPLKYELSGCWSRRIDREHRLVYDVKKDKIRILACRYHY